MLLVYAHPDDEAIAVGGRLHRLSHAHFVQVTDGAPLDNTDGERLGLTREVYRSVREKESIAAFHAGGVPHPRRTCLSIPDKEAALRLAALVDRIQRFVVDERAEWVFTHPYEGGHADHDACAFAVHTAVRGLSPNGKPVPRIVESPFYHGAGGVYRVGQFLPDPDAGGECVLTLNAEEQCRKLAMLAAFRTQATVLRDFAVTHEHFRVAPRYDFTQPAHDGPAYYERFIEGFGSSRFCSLAAEARTSLKVYGEDVACR